MQKATEQRQVALPVDDLVAASHRAEAWAGEPFLHNGEEPGEVLAPGTARKQEVFRSF